jgi:mRNA-degrading endonuclease RelE of RelBE toxin-antitoxin system
VKRIVWTEAAKADVRALDKPTAMRVLSALHRFAESGVGDVKARIGDYRLFFTYSAFEVIEVLRVVHRREAYR